MAINALPVFMADMIVRVPWESFPPITVHTSVSALKGHPAYPDAEKGDSEAVRRVVNDLLNPALVRVKVDYIVPVQRLDFPGRWNSIPLEFARATARAIGAQVLPLVVQDNIPPPPTVQGASALTAQPSFVGTIPKGNYLIVSDYVNLGSALANLRGFIEHRRGRVVLASSLTAGLFATKLAPDRALISTIQRQFKYDLAIFPETLGFPPTFLTQREAHFVLGLKNLECLRNPLLPTHNQIRPSV